MVAYLINQSLCFHVYFFINISARTILTDFFFEPNMQQMYPSSAKITHSARFQWSPSLAKGAKNNEILMATSQQRFLPLRKKDDA